MLQALLFSLLIIATSMLLLGVRLLFGKPFAKTHVEGNKALSDRGIHCAQAQDAEMRRPKRQAVTE